MIVHSNGATLVRKGIGGVVRHSIGLEWKQVATGRVPVPERKRKGRIADEAAENLFVEKQIGAMPWQEPPASVNLLAPQAVERSAAIPTMHLPLVKPVARIVGAL